MTDDVWRRYYRAIEGRAPRPLFLAALARFEAEGFDERGAQAVDLGCGDGTETLALLARGWRVLAADREPDAVARVLAGAPPGSLARLDARVAAFDELALPPADLVYAGLSLPFCHPGRFAAAWASVRGALRPGGRFAGHLFGDRDGWAADPAMTFHSAAQLAARLEGLEVESVAELEEDRPTALGEPKRWHIFEVVARRPDGMSNAERRAAGRNVGWGTQSGQWRAFSEKGPFLITRAPLLF